jgi:hypothetical protein
MFSKVVLNLEEVMQAIEKSVFDFPPATYDKFMEAVGKRNGIKIAIAEIHNSIHEDDELK